VVYGTKQSGKLKSGPRRTELFVFRVSKDIDIDSIKTYLTDEGVAVADIERTSSEQAYTNSYHIIVEGVDPSMVLSADFWPEGIGCRRYWRNRSTTTSHSDG